MTRQRIELQKPVSKSDLDALLDRTIEVAHELAISEEKLVKRLAGRIHIHAQENDTVDDNSNNSTERPFYNPLADP